MESGPTWNLLLVLFLQFLQTVAAIYPRILQLGFKSKGVLRIKVSPQRDGALRSIRFNGNQTYLLLIKVRYIGSKPLELLTFSGKDLIVKLPNDIEILEAFISGLRPSTLSSPDFQIQENKLSIKPFALNSHESFDLVLILNEKVDYDSVDVSLTLLNVTVTKCDDSKSFWQKNYHILLRTSAILQSITAATLIYIGLDLFFSYQPKAIGLIVAIIGLLDMTIMLYLLRKYFSYVVKD